jgi:hypothetical protein
MTLRLLRGGSADAPCLRRSGAGGRQRACLETAFWAGSCCLRGAADGLCRSFLWTRRHLRDGRDDRSARSASGDRNCPGDPGRRDVLGGLACPLKLQNWDERGARSWGAADGWIPLYLQHGGNCHALKHRCVAGGGSRLRGAAGDLSMGSCDRGRAFRDRARRSCRGRALRKRDARNGGARLASRAKSRRDLPLLPRSGWAHSVPDRHLLR